MATFILVHGGGHGGWCYQLVARRLQAQGHVVYAPSLAGMGEHGHLITPDIGLDAQIDGVVRLLHFEDLHDAILVGHSYGGMVITGIADRAADRVGHRVYLDAAYPTQGQSLVDHAGPAILGARQGARVVDGVELVLFAGTDPLGFYGVTDPAMIEWMKPRLTPHPWRCFEDKLVLTNEAAMRAIPESHIICSVTKPGRDMALLLERSQGRVWDIDTGHDLMLTEPDWVAARLADVAATMV
jgi:pimeloyl-ACP methyl ester carboxylesterase